MPERQIIDSDVVVLGAGAAGMMAALAAAEATDSRERSVCCVSKMPPATPNCTTRAYGDITWALSEHEDELVRQIHETGGWLGELDAIRGLARRVPTVLDRLRLLGVELDEPRPAAEGMPGVIRWSYRGRDSGQSVLDRIRDRALERGVRFFCDHMATQLLVSRNGVIDGVATVSLKARRPTIFRAGMVILATGGGACLYARTDNPDGTTGDGFALAYGAGAELVDLELISFGYPSQRVRDILEREEEMREELLGLGHAHYFLGGVAIDPSNHQSPQVGGLYAAGEVSGGLFGAGRLGGSALADCLAGAIEVGGQADRRDDRTDHAGVDDRIDGACAQIERLLRGTADPAPVLQRIREIAWRGIGPVKTGTSITRALEELDALTPRLADLGGASREDIRHAVEAQNLHTLARLVALASLEREETRGNYWRVDHPEPDNASQLRRIVIRKGKSGPEVASRPLELPDDIAPSQPRIGAGCFNYIAPG